MRKNTLGALISSSALIGSLLFASVAFAQTATPTTPPGQGAGWGHMGGRAPGVFGTVSAVSGNTITVASKGRGPNSSTTPTTYTVNATGATVTKNGAASTVGGIAVGDTVMVAGTVSGTNVTATTIRDGVGGMPGRGKGGTGVGTSTRPMGLKGANPIIQGNGQPVIGGAVAAINGASLTVTNKSNVTYTVDASKATVEKGNATSSVSAIVVGDNVIVQGAVNGQAVTASSVMDSGAPNTSVTPTTSSPAHPAGMGGFFGAIGGFFHSLFGF